MKKLCIVLSLASTALFPAPVQSISARLNAQQPKPADKAGKVIVACACEDLFPTVQEILVLSKSDVKDIVKAQLDTMGLNKEQLNSVKLMVKDAEPLLLEGAQVAAQLVKKHGKQGIAVYQRCIESMDSLDSESFDELLTLVLGDVKLQDLMAKVQAFNEKWAESFAAIMKASDESQVKREMVMAQVQESLEKMLGIALSHKRAMRIQSLVLPIASKIKTQADLMRLLQSCLSELETKLPSLVVSTEQFVLFVVPFLATVITESVDETLKSMPA